jgi:hypothetical protein
MLGFAPLAALPLAAVQPALILAVEEQLSGTGAITFAGSASAGAVTPMTATGVLTFAGSGFLITEVYRSATGAITFAGNPLLRVAGKPWIFTALTDAFQFRADGADFTVTAQTVSFDFRGVPE